jgi:hypothetical protein
MGRFLGFRNHNLGWLSTDAASFPACNEWERRTARRCVNKHVFAFFSDQQKHQNGQRQKAKRPPDENPAAFIL